MEPKSPRNSFRYGLIQVLTQYLSVATLFQAALRFRQCLPGLALPVHGVTLGYKEG